MKLTRMKLKLVKHAPAIMMGVGMVTIGAGVVMACRSTLKVDDILERHKDLLENARSLPDQVNPVDNTEIDEKTVRKEVAKVYGHTALSIAKLYALPAGLIVTGYFLSISGFVKLHKYAAGVTAAYDTLLISHNKLKKAVIDDQGVEKYHEYMYGKGKKKTVEAKTVNDDGEEIYKNTQAIIMEDGREIPLSGYAQLYARGISKQWDANEWYNRTYINGRMEMLTVKLIDRGHVFLNEAYEALGFPHTKEGSVIGWIYDPSDPDSVDHVEFDVHEVWLPEVNKDDKPIYEVAYYIDFPNLSGVILDKI